MESDIHNPSPEMPLQKEFIFIADDDLDDIEFLQFALMQIDPAVNVRWKLNGQDAYSFLQSLDTEHLPAIIILDLNLPKISGRDILILLRENNTLLKNIPKIIWSTSSELVDKETCMNAGADTYFVKASGLKELDSIARQIMSLKNRTESD